MLIVSVIGIKYIDTVQNNILCVFIWFFHTSEHPAVLGLTVSQCVIWQFVVLICEWAGIRHSVLTTFYRGERRHTLVCHSQTDEEWSSHNYLLENKMFEAGREQGVIDFYYSSNTVQHFDWWVFVYHCKVWKKTTIASVIWIKSHVQMVNSIKHILISGLCGAVQSVLGQNAQNKLLEQKNVADLLYGSPLCSSENSPEYLP